MLPVTRTTQLQELQERCRTIRSITGMIRSSSRTTVMWFYKVLRGFKRVNKDLFFMMITSFLMPFKAFERLLLLATLMTSTVEQVLIKVL